jgi:hypothetical protein
MVDRDGAPHVSKPMPVKVAPPVRAESPATGEAGCAVPDVMPLVTGTGTGAVGDEVAGAVVDDPDEPTVVARALSIAELSAPHVASSSTP